MFRDLRYLTCLLACSVLLPSVGCKQYYNGAIGVSTGDYEAVQAYHRAREQKINAQQNAAEYRSTGVKRTAQPGSSAAHIDELGQILSPTPTRYVTDPSQPIEQPIGQQVVQQAAGSVSGEPTAEQGFATAGGPEAPIETVSTSPVSPYGNLPGERGAISPLDSTGQIRRVSFTREGADFDVTLDGTGDHLIYSSTRHRETADIYRQRVDGSAITQLTDDSGNDVMPALSPDGKTIAFASDRSGNWDIYLMDADGGPAVQLTSDTTHDIHPSFSPDGKTLVYCSLSDRSGQWELVTIHVDNPTTKRYIGNGLFPQWSPDGNTILYQRARERGTRWFSVWTVQLDERGEAGSPTEVVGSSEYACITPSWSPDGKAVVFCTVTNPDADTQGRPAESDLWLARADGSGRTRLTRGRFSNLQPVWAGDNAIYFISNRATGGVENIWAMDPNDAVRVAFPGNGNEQTQTADVPTPSE